jgi:single-strand DNA-binding protein
MLSLNRVLLIGTVDRDPIIRQTPNGTPVACLTLSVARRWHDKATRTDKTSFSNVDVTCFRREAEFTRDHVRRGNAVFAEGYLNLDSWEDRQSGKKRFKLIVIAETLQLVRDCDRTSSPQNGALKAETAAAEIECATESVAVPF